MGLSVEVNMKQREELLLRLMTHNAHPEELPNFFVHRKHNHQRSINLIPERFGWLMKQSRSKRERSELLSRPSRNQFSTLGDPSRRPFSKPMTTSFQFRGIPDQTDHINERQHTHDVEIDTDGCTSVLGDVQIDLQEKQNRSLNNNYRKERKVRMTKTTASTRPIEHIKVCEKRLELPVRKLQEARYTPKNHKETSQHYFSKKSNLSVNPEWLVTQKVTLQEHSHPASRSNHRNLTGKSGLIRKKKPQSDIPIRPWDHWQQNQNAFEDFQMT